MLIGIDNITDNLPTDCTSLYITATKLRINFLVVIEKKLEIDRNISLDKCKMIDREIRKCKHLNETFVTIFWTNLKECS